MLKTYSSMKIDILPTNLSISTDQLWQIINKSTSVLIIDVNNLSILFANPNSLKELKILENNPNLTISSILGTKFKIPINYGENFTLNLQSQEGIDTTIEMDNSLVIWDNSPAYMVILKSCVKK